MGKRTRLTTDLMDNIWLLYQKGITKTEIVHLLHLSIASVSRVIKAFELASSGIIVSTENEFKDCKHIALYANNKFNRITRQSKEDLQNILFDVLDLLEQIKELITKLL